LAGAQATAAMPSIATITSEITTAWKLKCFIFKFL
jgi:hypothetical protein